MDEQILLVKKWLSFTNSLSAEKFSKALSAKTAVELAEGTGISIDEAKELMPAQLAYLKNPFAALPTTTPERDLDNKHDKKEPHEDHGGHVEAEHAPDEPEPTNIESKATTESSPNANSTPQNKTPIENEAAQTLTANKPRPRFEQMVIAGKAITEKSTGNSNWGENEDIADQHNQIPSPSDYASQPISEPTSTSDVQPSPSFNSSPSFEPMPSTPPTPPPSSPPMQRPMPSLHTQINPLTRPGRRGRPSRFTANGKGVLKKGAKTLVKKGLTWLFTTPLGWCVLGVIAAVIFFILAIAAILEACKVDQLSLATRPSIWPLVAVGHMTGLCSTPYTAEVPENANGVFTTIEGPLHVDNNGEITYTITARYDPYAPGVLPLSELSLFGVPLFDHTYVNSTGESTPKTDSRGNRYYQWLLSANQDTPEDYEFSFTLTVKPVIEDGVAVSALYASDVYKVVSYTEQDSIEKSPDVGDYTTWDDTPPSIDQEDINAGINAEPSHYTCGGKYTTIMTQLSRNYNTKLNNRMRGTGTNFGDPVCSFSEQKLRTVIARHETQTHIADGYVDFWMEIAKCESPGNGPNGWSKAFDTWGQFQMFRSSPNPGKEYDPAKEPTRGDLPWQRQAQIAVARNNQILGGSFKYWEAAYCLCGNERFKGKKYCAQILDPNGDGNKSDSLAKTCSYCPR